MNHRPNIKTDIKNKLMIAILLLILTIVLSVILSGCSGNSQSNNQGNSPATETPKHTGTPITELKSSKYYFDYNGTKIEMNADAKPILDALGEPQHVFEAPSCAFEGMDKVYTYSGIELRAYADEKSERISSVSFMDDSVNTREGICLGDKLDKVVAQYGEGYEKNGDFYIYVDGNCKLSFLIENGEVTSVEYSIVTE